MNSSQQIYVELIGVGFEITRGTIIDINSPYLARKMVSLGLEVKKVTIVGDSEAVLAEVIEDAKEKKGIIIISGGLGTTFDDITKKVASRVLGRSLVLNQKILEDVNLSHKKRGLKPIPGYERQALFPLRAEPLKNTKGVAWGFYIKYKSTHFFFLPGVPSELSEMVKTGVIPIIKREFHLHGAAPSSLLKVFGLTESEVEDRIKVLLKEKPGVRFFIRVSFPEIHLEISGSDDSERTQNAFKQCVERVEDRLSPYIICKDDETIEAVVGEYLRSNGLTLFAAESCTGGLLGHRITSVSGSSDYFLGGIIAYNNKMKEKCLGVSSWILNDSGAVSRETAIEMAKGARYIGGSDLGIAITGVAGPEGGSKEKPVGTVYIALFDGKIVRVERFSFAGERDEIKILSSYRALEMLRRYVIGGGAEKDQSLHSY